MNRILLLDADDAHARGIAWALRAISCRTMVCSNLETAVSILQIQTFDAVVVVTSPGRDWEVRVDVIRQATFNTTEQPPVLCLMRGPYRGPAERVYATRTGFTVIYDR